MSRCTGMCDLELCEPYVQKLLQTKVQSIFIFINFIDVNLTHDEIYHLHNGKSCIQIS